MQDHVRPDAGKADAGVDAVGVEEHLAVEHLAKVRDGEARMGAADDIERDGAGLGDASAWDHVSAAALDRGAWTSQQEEREAQPHLTAS